GRHPCLSAVASFIAPGKMPAATRQPGMAVLLCRVVEQASLPVTCRQASRPVGGPFIAPGKMPAATRQPGMAVLLCRVVEQASLPVTCRQASLPVGGPFIATGKMPAATRQPGMAVLLCKMPAATRQPAMAVLLCRVVEQAFLPVVCRQASLPVGGCFLHCAGQDARRDTTARDGCPTLPRGRTGILACSVPAGIPACRRLLPSLRQARCPPRRASQWWLSYSA